MKKLGVERTANFLPVVTYIPQAYTAYVDSAIFSDPSIAPTLRAYSDKQRQWLAEDRSIGQIDAQFVADPRVVSAHEVSRRGLDLVVVQQFHHRLEPPPLQVALQRQVTGEVGIQSNGNRSHAR